MITSNKRFFGGDMIRISLPYLFEISNKLEVLASIENKQRHEVIYTLYQADKVIDDMLNNSVFSSSLRSSREAAFSLKAVIGRQLSNESMHEEIGYYEAINIVVAFNTYKTALLAELGVAPAYLVTQKSGFDTETLLTKGLAIFPPSLARKVPEAEEDAKSAAKALAFEMSTASGFHTFRVVESVLRRYYLEISKNDTIPNQKKSLGGVLHLMKCEEIGDPHVISALDQIKNLHRNPLAHPDVTIDVEEAVSLIGMSQSVITVMLQRIAEPYSELFQNA